MAYSCPVALAMHRALGYRVRVNETFWQIDRNGPSGIPQLLAIPRHPFPTSVTTFIHEFDNVGPESAAIGPFEFDVKVPV